MSRRRKGQKIDGWLILDKPLHLTSSQAVGSVRKILNAQKAGHAGTLDPLASGVLPIGLGEATKAMPFITASQKSYDFSLYWGEARSTDDLEGDVTERCSHIPGPEEIEQILPRFLGEIEQVPPAYSAIKIKGKRAYDLARAGEKTTLLSRLVQIHSLIYQGGDETGHEARFSLCCGKGTYVRSLARDLGKALGSCAHVTALRRTSVGPFAIGDAISLEKLEELGHCARAQEVVHPVSTALDDIPALAVTEPQAKRLQHGQSLRHQTDMDGQVRVMCGDRLIAIATASKGQLQPVRVFNSISNGG